MISYNYYESKEYSLIFLVKNNKSNQKLSEIKETNCLFVKTRGHFVLPTVVFVIENNSASIQTRDQITFK